MTVFNQHNPVYTSGFLYFGTWMIPYYRREKVILHPDKAFVETNNGTYILPFDGSYVRFIANSWYE